MSDERRILTPVRKALLEAAELIEKNGWTQRKWRDGAKVCAATAIADAAKNRSHAREASDRLLNYIGQPGIPWWNDAPERTQAEVVAALRGAAVS